MRRRRRVSVGTATLLTALLASPVGADQPRLMAPSDTIDLTGGVTVSDPDLARVLEPFLSKDSAIRTTFEFQFDRNGQINSCQVRAMPAVGGNRALPVEAERLVCERLTKFGTITPDPRLAVSYTKGYAALVLLANWEYRPAMPVKFTTPPAGIAIDLRHNPSNGACWVQSSGIPEQTELAICKAWQGQGRPGQVNVIYANQTRSYRLNVVAQKVASAVGLRWVDAIADQGKPMTWPVVMPSADLMVPELAGPLKVRAIQDEYPVPALRAGLQSRVVALVRFGSDGKPDFCAPVASTNTSYMGNVTCMILLRRTMRPVGSDKALFAGKFWRAGIMWRLP